MKKLLIAAAVAALLLFVLLYPRSERTPELLPENGGIALKEQQTAPVMLPEESVVSSPETETPEIKSTSEEQMKNIREEMKLQKSVDEQLLAELESDSYTLQDPLIVVNPYGSSPLSAVMLFTTDGPSNISVHIPGDTQAANVDFTFEGYRTRHQIPVYGLYPGRDNLVEITALTEDGMIEKTALIVTTEPLPAYFDEIHHIVKVFDETNYEPGLNFVYTNLKFYPYRYAFDAAGDIRWFIIGDPAAAFPARFSTNERGFFFPVGATDQGEVFIYERNPLGKILNVYYSPYGAHHEISLSGDNLLIAGSKSVVQGATNGDFIYKLNLKSGEITGELDYKNILDRTRAYGVYAGREDWMHINSIVDYQGDVIVSSNFQSLVMRNSWDGKIKWMLSDPADYLEMYDEYLLTPIGEDFEYSYNQHAAVTLPDYDGNPDTVDILLFDNGSSRYAVDAELQRRIRNNEIAEPLPYSRMVHYRINEKDMTVEQIWQYGKEHPELFAVNRSNANLMANGNIFGTFDMDEDTPYYRIHAVLNEVNREGELIWQAILQSGQTEDNYSAYRCERMNIYTDNADNLHLGEEARLFIPENILEAGQ